MGYEMLVGPEGEETEIYHLGSGTDINDFMKWIATLPAEIFPRLKEFAKDFQTMDGDALAKELAKATETHEPTVPGVIATANEIGMTCDELPNGKLFRIAS